MDYVQITPKQREEMLKAVGARSIDDLLKQVPQEFRLDEPLDLPPALDEHSLRKHLSELAAQNNSADDKVCFLGAGVYDHFIPSVVDFLAMKGEFLTAYTPYQAEASQGSLQAFFEFQTMICQLTGMEVANASLYEGATALAEAAIMALNVTGKREIIVSEGVHPHYRQVLKTYLSDLPARYTEMPLKNGVLDTQELESELEPDTAAIICQSPNFLGHIERVETTTKFAHANESLMIQAFNPLSLGLLKHPGEMGVDIAVGEGQPLGIPLQFGGPYLGLFATKMQYVRKMPGRLVGQTVDADGKRALLPDAANPRAAHSPREGDEQCLHESGPARPSRQRLSGDDGPRRPAAGGTALLQQSAIPCRSTQAGRHPAPLPAAAVFQ